MLDGVNLKCINQSFALALAKSIYYITDCINFFLFALSDAILKHEQSSRLGHSKYWISSELPEKSMQQGAGTHIETTELKFRPCTRAPVPCLNFYLGSCKKGVFRLVTRQYCIWASCSVTNCGHRLISIMITFASYYRIDLFIVEQTRAAYT